MNPMNPMTIAADAASMFPRMSIGDFLTMCANECQKLVIEPNYVFPRFYVFEDGSAIVEHHRHIEYADSTASNHPNIGDYFAAVDPRPVGSFVA